MAPVGRRAAVLVLGSLLGVVLVLVAWQGVLVCLMPGVAAVVPCRAVEVPVVAVGMIGWALVALRWLVAPVEAFGGVASDGRRGCVQGGGRGAAGEVLGLMKGRWLSV